MAYLSFLIIPVLLLFPLFIRLDIYFDLSRKLFAVNARLLGITVAKVLLRETDDCIQYSFNNNDYKEFQFQNRNIVNKGQILQILRGFKVKSATVYVRFGTDDAADTALISAAIDCITDNIQSKKFYLKKLINNDGLTSVNAEIKLFTVPISIIVAIINTFIKERNYVGK